MDVRLVSIKRGYNLGNYENASIEMQAIPDVNEDAGLVMKELGEKIDNFAQEKYGISPKVARR